MLNRPIPRTRASLDVRRVIAGALRECLRDLPPTPFDWSTFDASAALRSDGLSSDLRLAELTRLLCTAPARIAELRALWNECVLTGAFALHLAPHLGADPNSSAIAGLLHRLGDLLTLRALGATEHAAALRLDGANKSELCAEHGAEQQGRALRAWGVPVRAATTATDWNRLGAFPEAAADAATVYLARLLAVERLTPQFCAPDMVAGALAEAGVSATALSELRCDATIPALLKSLQ